MTAFLIRLGSFGLLLIAGAPLFGRRAGAGLVHHHDRLSPEGAAFQHQQG